jgi:O-antigen/teichoic acid export membrane protein
MRYYYLFTALAACLISGFLVVFAEPIIRALFGAEFVAAASVLRLLAVGQVFGALAEASSSYLLMSGKERVFGSLSLVGLAINVLLNVWLIPGLGARGAAIATASTNLLFFVVAAAIVARALKMRRRATSARGEPRY